MSLDAIDPRKGHVPGNLRWICWFLNSGNWDKDKTFDSEDDHQTWWTKEFAERAPPFLEYIQYNEYNNIK